MKYLEKFWKKFKFRLYFFIGGLALASLVGYGLYEFGLIEIATDKEAISCPKVDMTVGASKKLLVDIRGAINKPGVYEFSSNDIVDELIILAGGFKSNADFSWIDQNINFSRKVEDREKLYFPFKVVATETNTSASTSAVDKKISLNTASQSELESLPGIGPATASKIIEGRPYKKLEDLLEVKGIGESLLEKIRDLVKL